MKRTPRPMQTRLLCLLFAMAAASEAATPMVASGGRHSLALRSDGTVRAWGNDSVGQLGVGRVILASRPTAVTGISDVSAVATGATHTAALKRDGSVWTWGLGGTTGIGQWNPKPVNGISGAIAVSAGSAYTLALKGDGTVWAWGDDSYGQSGAPQRNLPSLEPVQVVGLSSVIAISAGDSHAVALRGDGTVWTWGSNGSGELGRVGQSSNRVAQAVVGISNVTAISAGNSFTLALKSDGTVWGWGANSSGQLGDQTWVSRVGPYPVFNMTGVRAISAGYNHAMAVKSDGSVWGWGFGLWGQIDGNTASHQVAVRVPFVSNPSAISSGHYHTVALSGNGTLSAWGGNKAGQLGDGTTSSQYTAVPVLGATGVTAVSAGSEHTVALTTDGRVWVWGSNEWGQFGDGTPINRSAPLVVEGLDNVQAVAAGKTHSAALRADGTVWAWGDTRMFERGNGTSTRRGLAVPIAGLTGVTAIAAGCRYTLALRGDGSVWSVGEPGTTPVPIAGMSGIVAIAGGCSHVLGLRGDGTVWAQGSNLYGELGDGTSAERSSAVPVSGLTGISAIAAGDNHSVALKSDGSVWTWGNNGYGQLGDNTTANRSSPVRVDGVAGATAIAAGGGNTLALASDLRSWGNNYYGQVGDGTTFSRRIPVGVTGLANIASISTSGDPFNVAGHALALRTDGSVASWGANFYGELGDGSLSSRTRPVFVIRESGAGSFQANDWFLDLDAVAPNTIPADKVPVFLAVASGDATHLTVDLRFRQQDVGTTASTYVFALVPSSMVAPAQATFVPTVVGKAIAGGKADPVPCVLAQLNASGRLQGVSTSTLQAYATGVLSAQGQAVTVLDGVDPGKIAGATFFIGVGATGGAMIDSGINRSVASVDGSVACKPQAPRTGWWWNSAQGGRGYSIEVNDRSMFMAAYFYDESGRATWLVAGGPTSLDGSLFTAPLYSASGGTTLSGSYRANTARPEGQVTLAFNDASHGTMIWPGGTVSIERFNIVQGGLDATPQSNVPESGWWWNASENGRGFFIEWQNGSANIAGYMYDDAGNPVWYVTVATTPNARAFNSAWWQYANGQTMSGPYRAPTQVSNNVGPATIQFHTSTTATMTLPGGRQLSLTRFRF